MSDHFWGRGALWIWNPKFKAVKWHTKAFPIQISAPKWLQILLIGWSLLCVTKVFHNCENPNQSSAQPWMNSWVWNECVFTPTQLSDIRAVKTNLILDFLNLFPENFLKHWEFFCQNLAKIVENPNFAKKNCSRTLLDGHNKDLYKLSVTSEPSVSPPLGSNSYIF